MRRPRATCRRQLANWDDARSQPLTWQAPRAPWRLLFALRPDDLHMATDYDASRKTEDEQKEESREARRLTSGEQDKTSGKIDEDETDLAESYELPGADLSDEVLSVEVTPRQTDEFTCTSCFLVQHQCRRASQVVDLCADCA